MDKPLVTLEDVTIRLRDKFILPHTSWEIMDGQHWAILGPNGAGKSTLVRVLTGDVPYVQGRIICHDPQPCRELMGYASFELQEHLIAREEIEDRARYFAHALDDFEKVRETLLAGSRDGGNGHPAFDGIVDLFDIRHLLDRGFRHLSSGEMRQVLIARALIKNPKLLILDEPFAGIDAESRKRLSESINQLMKQGLQIILVTHREQEILPLISHVLCVKEGKVLMRGKRQDILTPENLRRLYDGKQINSGPLMNWGKPAIKKITSLEQNLLVDMKNVTVKYGNVQVLNDLNWTVRGGENWAVVGPNGSGKTTLLSLITGDHPQAYANEIYLFGKRRGSGESIWDIKARIGMISAEFQTLYRNEITARDVVASGIFDSIGLYRHLSIAHKQQVGQWIEFLGIAPIADKVFTQLSYGERRMVLLARAVVKSPEFLVLDEPCQGLDPENRRLLMGLIEKIGKDTDTNLLYVTHYPDEIPKCIDHVLSLGKLQS